MTANRLLQFKTKWLDRLRSKRSRTAWPLAWVIVLLVGTTHGLNPAVAATYDDALAGFQAGQYDKTGAIAAAEIQRGVRGERWPQLLIECQMTTGSYADALQTYETAIQRYPFSISLRHQGLDVLRYNGRADEVGQAEADLFLKLQQSFNGYISRENLIAAGRFLTDRGEDARKVLELFYDRVRDQHPDFVESYVATAELAIRNGDFRVAAETLRPAIEIDPTNPTLHYLMATAFDASDPAVAAKSIEHALRLNPRHPASLRFAAEQAIDAEKYELAEQQLQTALSINADDPLALALQAVIAHVRGQYELEKTKRDAALSKWDQNPQVDFLIGKMLSQKYRFAEGAEYQNRALELDSSYTPASFQLAQDRLRLGDEDLGWKIAERVAKADPYNVIAYNLLTLRDKTSTFTVLEQDGIRVRMDPREAALYGDEVLELLSDAKRVLCEKYKVYPDKPILVEIFPEQSDFAIRTFGLPGGAGYLGVCFGRVITANSPASQGQRPSNWKSVLWHEFCHVVTLEKTNNRMPRWLSEGISVYEERQRDPSWGERMNPSYRSMVLGDGKSADELTPVSELSAAFLSPKSGLHLQFAYFESSLVVEYLIDQYGLDSLLAVLDELATGISINDALAKNVGSIVRLDHQFRQHARKLAEQYGSLADWSRQGLPTEGDAANLATWQFWTRMHPTNYWGLRTVAERLVADKQWSDAKRTLDRMAMLDVLTTERNGPLEWAARVEQELGHENAETSVIGEIMRHSSDALPSLRRSIVINQSKQQWPEMLAAAEQALAIQPLLPEFHAAAAVSAEATGQPTTALRALDALLILDPIDPAALHLRMAQMRLETAQLAAARRSVLMALELAPRYRDAHQLLLQLSTGSDAVIEISAAEGDTP